MNEALVAKATLMKRRQERKIRTLHARRIISAVEVEKIRATDFSWVAHEACASARY
jgi:hypothetical protein